MSNRPMDAGRVAGAFILGFRQIIGADGIQEYVPSASPMFQWCWIAMLCPIPECARVWLQIAKSGNKDFYCTVNVTIADACADCVCGVGFGCFDPEFP